MNPPKTLFDYLKFPLGLGYRRPSAEERRYAAFNRRLFAFAIDAALMAVCIAPVVDLVFISIHGERPGDMAALQNELRQIADPAEANRIFFQTLYESGTIRHWLDNVMYQVTALQVICGLFWLRWGATPGKMLMRIKIVDAKTEGPLSFFQVVMRASCYLISAMFFMLGFFWIGIDKRRQAWHDKLADTVVLALPLWPKSGSPTADR